jgi:hypothetical protein
MRATCLFPLALAGALAAASPALAQAKKDAKGPAAADVRYFTSIGGIMDDQADTILKETRSGGKVTAAVLDVCYPMAGSTDRKDRFVATLTVEGNKLTGATESLEGKQPVSISLTRKAAAAGVSFEGRITIGSSVSNISSADNTDVSEKDFRSSQDTEDEIAAAPADYVTVSPESVAVRLKPDAVAGFVNTLRGQNIEVVLSSLLPSCAELRRGEQAVRMTIDPERAAETVAKFKTMPGVLAAGWATGRLDLERTIRFTAAEWREGGRLAKDRLASTLSELMAKALNATAQPPRWNEDTGELKLAFRRPNASLPGLQLTQTLEYSALVAADKPGGSDKLVLWLSYPTIINSDEGSGPKLRIADATDSNGDESNQNDEGDSLAVIARSLKAQRWDSENSAWK